MVGPFFRQVSNHGWAGVSGGARAFVVNLSMPQSTGNNVPAFWILNAKIVHTAQYGCNCRGTGPKGCGELDVLEVIPNQNPQAATSTIYSYLGATGTGTHYITRPTNVVP